MEVWFPERTQSPIPLWMRIFVGSFSLLAGSLMLVRHVRDFKRVSELGLGIWFLFVLPPFRRSGESKREYWRKPRVIASTLLLMVIVIASCRNLYLLYRN
jgi:hypothetical protein